MKVSTILAIVAACLIAAGAVGNFIGGNIWQACVNVAAVLCFGAFAIFR